MHTYIHTPHLAPRPHKMQMGPRARVVSTTKSQGLPLPVHILISALSLPTPDMIQGSPDARELLPGVVNAFLFYTVKQNSDWDTNEFNWFSWFSIKLICIPLKILFYSIR